MAEHSRSSVEAPRLQWNAGGWFGSLLGCTLWILVAAVLAGRHDARTGWTLAALFATPVVVGALLWSRRRTVSCHRAFQAILLLSGAAGAAAIGLLERRELWATIQSGAMVSAPAAVALLAGVIAFLLLLFHVRFGRPAPGGG